MHKSDVALVNESQVKVHYELQYDASVIIYFKYSYAILAGPCITGLLTCDTLESCLCGLSQYYAGHITF